MKIPIYWGCLIPHTQYAYEMSIREVLPKLEMELIELENVSCCGLPMRSVNTYASIYLAMRNLAVAEGTGLKNLLVPCTGCHLSFSEAIHFWKQDEELRKKISLLLAEEGLKYGGTIRIWHLIDLLHDLVTKETILKSMKRKLDGLTLASHYGCHIIRPSTLGRIDDPENPRKLDDLIALLGAKSLDYPEKLDCCGALLLWSRKDGAFTFSGLKLKAVQDLGFDGLVVTCPACQNMFDARQKVSAATVGAKLNLPVLYYSQLLGVALGINEEKLGLHLNRSPIDRLLEKIG